MTQQTDNLGRDRNRYIGKNLTMNERMQRIPEEELLNELLRVADELDRAPKREDMKEKGQYSRRPYESRFGSWNEALEAAGLTPRRKTGLSKEQLIGILRDMAGVLEEPPSKSDLGSFDEAPSASVFYNRFGSWNGALREAGLEPKYRTLSDTELLGEFQRLADELGRIPTTSDMRRNGEYAASTYQKRFGTWEEVLNEAGFEVKYGGHGSAKIPKKRLVEALQTTADELGRTPRIEDVRDHVRFSFHTYRRRFGDYTTALEAAGLALYYVPCGEGSRLRDYGKNWTEVRKEAIARDGNVCQGCGVGGEELEQGLSVHHITPRREFSEDGELNAERANRIENLVAVCPSCHYKWEGVPLRPSVRGD